MRRIAGIVLAAGGSTRLGQPKQLLCLRGETLVHTAARAAIEAGCEPLCVVLGHAAEQVQQAVADLQPVLAQNEDWTRGLGSSIRAGLNAVQPISAAIILACDQPAIDASLVRSLIETHIQTGAPIVASQYGETLGIPALFSESCFGELLSLPDGRGAKSVIEVNPLRVAAVPFPAGALDLDTPGQLQAWIARTGLRTGSR